MTPDEAKKLREPFPPEMIGKLPRAGITLDYVGHAATTDRLLQVDPEWTWEPMGRDEHGNPAIVSGLGEANEPVCLWINLTVCGVTRPGFGSGKTAKIAIGDAIRNAAMRFGVALDLWAKEDLHASESAEGPNRDTASSENGPVADTKAAMSGEASAPSAENFADKARKAQEAKNSKPATKAQLAKVDALIAKAAEARGKTEDEARTAIVNDYGPLAELTAARADELAAKLERWAAA